MTWAMLRCVLSLMQPVAPARIRLTAWVRMVVLTLGRLSGITLVLWLGKRLVRQWTAGL